MGTWQKPQKPIKLRVRTKMMAHGYREETNMFSLAETNQSNDVVIQGEEISATSKESNYSVPHSSESNRSNGTAQKSPLASNSRSITPVAKSSDQSPPRTESVQTVRSESNHHTHSSLKEDDPSRPPSSVISGQPVTPGSSSSILKPASSPSRAMSNSSSRVASAPINSRSSQQSNAGSQIGSSQSQRTCSRTHSSSQYSRRPESRQKTGDQSVIGSSEGTRVGSPSSYMDSRPPSSIALTTSTKSGIKSRGVQCS